MGEQTQCRRRSSGSDHASASNLFSSITMDNDGNLPQRHRIVWRISVDSAFCMVLSTIGSRYFAMNEFNRSLPDGLGPVVIHPHSVYNWVGVVIEAFSISWARTHDIDAAYTGLLYIVGLLLKLQLRLYHAFHIRVTHRRSRRPGFKLLIFQFDGPIPDDTDDRNFYTGFIEPALWADEDAELLHEYHLNPALY